MNEGLPIPLKGGVKKAPAGMTGGDLVAKMTSQNKAMRDSVRKHKLCKHQPENNP